MPWAWVEHKEFPENKNYCGQNELYGFEAHLTKLTIYLHYAEYIIYY